MGRICGGEENWSSAIWSITIRFFHPLLNVPHSNRKINSRHGVPCGLQHL